MGATKMCFRTIMLYDFKISIRAGNCACYICDVFLPETLTERSYQNWFKKNIVRGKTENLAERFSVDHTTIFKHF